MYLLLSLSLLRRKKKKKKKKEEEVKMIRNTSPAPDKQTDSESKTERPDM